MSFGFIFDVGGEPAIDKRSNALFCSEAVKIVVREEILPNVCAYFLGAL